MPNAKLILYPDARTVSGDSFPVYRWKPSPCKRSLSTEPLCCAPALRLCRALLQGSWARALPLPGQKTKSVLANFSDFVPDFCSHTSLPVYNSSSGKPGDAPDNVVNVHLGNPARVCMKKKHMEQKRLGKQGLTVSAMGLGCMGMSDAYGPADEAESVATIHRAHAVHPISALQTEYSLWSRDPEDELIPTVRELSIGFVAYSPLGRGFLTGQLRRFEDLPQDDWRRHRPRFQGENFQKNLELVDRVKEIAATKQVTPAQLALAWLVAQGEGLVPIPGTKRRKNLEENVAALGITLTREDLQRIDEAAPKGAASGERGEDMTR